MQFSSPSGLLPKDRIQAILQQCKESRKYIMRLLSAENTWKADATTSHVTLSGSIG